LILLLFHFTNNILNSVEQILDSSNTSIAPPKHSAQPSNSSFLPSAPTISSSRVHINCEPTIATTREDTSDEETDEDETDEDETEDGDDDSGEKEEKVVPALQFGPPKVIRSSLITWLRVIFCFDFTTSFYLSCLLDMDHSGHNASVTSYSHDRSVEGNTFYFSFQYFRYLSSILDINHSKSVTRCDPLVNSNFAFDFMILCVYFLFRYGYF